MKEGNEGTYASSRIDDISRKCSGKSAKLFSPFSMSSFLDSSSVANKWVWWCGGLVVSVNINGCSGCCCCDYGLEPSYESNTAIRMLGLEKKKKKKKKRKKRKKKKKKKQEKKNESPSLANNHGPIVSHSGVTIVHFDRRFNTTASHRGTEIFLWGRNGPTVPCEVCECVLYW